MGSGSSASAPFRNETACVALCAAGWKDDGPASPIVAIGERRAARAREGAGYLQFDMQRTALASGRSSTMNPFRFGIWTAGSVFASITALAGIRPFRLRR